MQINVRNVDEEDKVNTIVFGRDGEHLEVYQGDNKVFLISEGELGDSVPVYLEDIDYLIAALQKAKVLWAPAETEALVEYKGIPLDCEENF